MASRASDVEIRLMGHSSGDNFTGGNNITNESAISSAVRPSEATPVHPARVSRRAGVSLDPTSRLMGNIGHDLK